MSMARILGLAALAGVTAAATAAPVMVMPPTFQTQAQLFTWIAADRNLGDPFDARLIRQIQADSRIAYVHDGSAGRIAVVRVELLNPDGSDRARTEGNSPFYVLRETPRGLLLMGRMFGRTYASHLSGGRLELDVQLQRPAASTIQMRFRVQDSTLINLSPLRQSFQDVIAGRAVRPASLT